MLTRFVRNHIVPIVFRDVNVRLDAERKFYENSFKILSDEITSLKSQVNLLVQVKNEMRARADEQTQTLARLTLDLNKEWNRAEKLRGKVEVFLKSLEKDDVADVRVKPSSPTCTTETPSPSISTSAWASGSAARRCVSKESTLPKHEAKRKGMVIESAPSSSCSSGNAKSSSAPKKIAPKNTADGSPLSSSKIETSTNG